MLSIPKREHVPALHSWHFSLNSYSLRLISILHRVVTCLHRASVGTVERSGVLYCFDIRSKLAWRPGHCSKPGLEGAGGGRTTKQFNSGLVQRHNKTHFGLTETSSSSDCNDSGAVDDGSSIASTCCSHTGFKNKTNQSSGITVRSAGFFQRARFLLCFGLKYFIQQGLCKTAETF